MIRKAVSAFVLMVVAAFVLAGCKIDTVSTKADSSGGAAARTGSSEAAQSAKIGDPITIEGNSDGEKVTVTAVQIVDNPAGADEFSSPSAGNKFVAVQFKIENSGSAAYSDSPGNGAKVIDADGQQFDAGLIGDTVAGPSFPASTTIAPGDSALGFITFEVPAAVAVAKVQFATNSGFGSTAQWNVA